MTTVLTYGTFDMFHVGHLEILQRLRAMGDRLVVGVSTDEFNSSKGKTSVFPFEQRSAIVAALRCVDEVFPEERWEQKTSDIDQYDVSILGMGEDWAGKFDDLSSQCQVVYLPRTPGVSTSEVKAWLAPFGRDEAQRLRQAVDVVTRILDGLD